MIQEHDDDQPMLYTIDETSFLLSVSMTTIRIWIKEGRLKVVRPSPAIVRISQSELRDFIRRSEKVTGGGVDATG